MMNRPQAGKFRIFRTIIVVALTALAALWIITLLPFLLLTSLILALLTLPFLKRNHKVESKYHDCHSGKLHIRRFAVNKHSLPSLKEVNLRVLRFNQ